MENDAHTNRPSTTIDISIMIVSTLPDIDRQIIHTHHSKFLNVSFCQYTTLKVQKLSTTVKF